MELDSLYQEVILDHYKHPLNKGLASTYGAQVHHVNPSCGDEITLNITAQDGVITAITWDGVGCSISQASVSIASDLLINKSFNQAELILNEFTELMQSKGTKEGNPDVLEDAVALEGDVIVQRGGEHAEMHVVPFWRHAVHQSPRSGWVVKHAFAAVDHQGTVRPGIAAPVDRGDQCDRGRPFGHIGRIGQGLLAGRLAFGPAADQSDQ